MDTDSQQNAQSAKLCRSLENCIRNLRELRNVVLSSHNFLINHLDTPQAFNDNVLESFGKKCEEYGQQMALKYKELEDEAKLLPNSTPPSLMVNKLNPFLLDCSTNPQMKEAYANTRSVFDWADSTSNYINFAYDLFKIAHITTLTQQRLRKLTLAYQYTCHQNIKPEPSSIQHNIFVTEFERFMGLKSFKHTELPFDYKLHCNFIERSVISCVIEIKYFAVSKNRTSDGQMVCLQKLLWLVNNGTIEYVHCVSPHEEWHYEDYLGIGGKKRIDLSQQSHFELYQKLSVYATMIVSLITQNASTAKIIHVLFNQIAKLFVIDIKCFKCGKRLKDFTPCIDPVSKNQMHTSCK